MKRVAAILTLLPLVASAQTRGQVEIDLAALCALVDVAQPAYMAANDGWPFRCFPPNYRLDGCGDVIGPGNLARANAAGFRVDVWKEGGANAGQSDGNGWSCSAVHDGERKRLAPRRVPGRSGRPPNTNHRAAHEWGEEGS